MRAYIAADIGQKFWAHPPTNASWLGFLFFAGHFWSFCRLSLLNQTLRSSQVSLDTHSILPSWADEHGKLEYRRNQAQNSVGLTNHAHSFKWHFGFYTSEYVSQDSWMLQVSFYLTSDALTLQDACLQVHLTCKKSKKFNVPQSIFWTPAVAAPVFKYVCCYSMLLCRIIINASCHADNPESFPSLHSCPIWVLQQ